MFGMQFVIQATRLSSSLYSSGEILVVKAKKPVVYIVWLLEDVPVLTLRSREVFTFHEENR